MKTTLTTLFLAVVLFVISQKTFSQQLPSDNFLEVSVRQYIPCSDEVASGTVTLHYFRFENGNGKVYRTHTQPQGAKLVGEKTGIVYNAVGVSQSKETHSLDGEAYTFKGIDNFYMIGTGKDGVKYKLHVNLVTTVNANGVLTADFDHESVTCQ